MTYAPARLVEVGRLWTAQGGVNLGIVGDVRHQATGVSYHLGADQLAAGAYSARTTRDRAGLTNGASAIDLGRLDGSLERLRDFSSWLVDQARASAPGTPDMREIIWSPDGKSILRWDRERGAASEPRGGEADSSHLTHTHISWYRDAERRDHTTAFRPYFETEDPMIDFELDQTEVGGIVTVLDDGASVVTIDGGDRPRLSAGMRRPAIGTARLKVRGDLPHYMIWVGQEIGFVLASDVVFEQFAERPASTIEVRVDGDPVWTGAVR